MKWLGTSVLLTRVSSISSLLSDDDMIQYDRRASFTILDTSGDIRFEFSAQIVDSFGWWIDDYRTLSWWWATTCSWTDLVIFFFIYGSLGYDERSGSSYVSFSGQFTIEKHVLTDVLILNRFLLNHIDKTTFLFYYVTSSPRHCAVILFEITVTRWSDWIDDDSSDRHQDFFRHVLEIKKKCSIVTMNIDMIQLDIDLFRSIYLRGIPDLFLKFLSRVGRKN